ncbi:hypothetical protein KDK95_33750 [Actinospica sp. MGRD01-02]|uniref:Uncharacterized protein n=1 Tax=Actinospica acidithermotolerans TaxID=2828514 RepID=A0A941EJ24_9ACTN|nr:hypothetical protein [Actinospica acidithermotolerans]MBR7831318.1 hypothetical protein [Actinospica acidithermotolerans]
MSFEDIENEMRRIGAYIASLARLEKDRQTRDDVYPFTWLLGVATVAEYVRASALDAVEDWGELASEWDGDTPGVQIVEQVKRAVFGALGLHYLDGASDTGGGS